ncbi:MAG TPA: YabP/YqfC family sporulation protein [Pseudogracilibacillus sp.]|nr:YabP/YqfC family sporulation protein [Pseudogracilibacillus sp.]
MERIKDLFNSLTQLAAEEQTPLFIMYSNKHIIFEQIEELLSFSNRRITLQSKLGIIEINGENLTISLLQQEEMSLSGRIYQVQFLNEKGDRE